MKRNWLRERARVIGLKNCWSIDRAINCNKLVHLLLWRIWSMRAVKGACAIDTRVHYTNEGAQNTVTLKLRVAENHKRWQAGRNKLPSLSKVTSGIRIRISDLFWVKKAQFIWPLLTRCRAYSLFLLQSLFTLTVRKTSQTLPLKSQKNKLVIRQDTE